MRVRLVADRIAISSLLVGVHDVFHISALRKMKFKPSHVIDFALLELNEDLNYEAPLVRILVLKETYL